MADVDALSVTEKYEKVCVPEGVISIVINGPRLRHVGHIWGCVPVVPRRFALPYARHQINYVPILRRPAEGLSIKKEWNVAGTHFYADVQWRHCPSPHKRENTEKRRTYIQKYNNTYIHTYIYTYTHTIHTHTHTYIHTYIHT